ncbi:MAG: two-component system, OmpR family, sensor histidine kinase MprB [Candidatus Eremiobacteraeota bacterium]|jgi:two-component system OmpR family sensor kinase|nr:two-component system, OmpR family, sensor histidine kinase MprB [Candidatus Eremiobacteraeota bacterium]
MFTSFARRLTGWYVVSATVMVVALLMAVAVVGLVMYVRMVQDGIDADAREAQAFSVRAEARGQKFQDAAIELQNRLARSGIRMLATGPIPHDASDARRPRSPRATSGPLLIRPARSADRGAMKATRPDRNDPPKPDYIILNGKRVFGDLRDIRTQGSRIGFALGTALGAHFQRVDLVDGDLRIMPDPDATFRVALWLLTGVGLLGALAGVVGWFLGRYITGQVLRPLVDVTHALHRFATRDFTPQPIAVAGKSEFDAIAVAYNAAAAQVAAAFVERQQAESQMRQFVADAGHELRTPLTIVLGYIDLLRRKADEGDERSRRIFSAIGIEGARMRTLIDNLVLLARMEGADVRPPEPFELCALLEDIIDARRLLHPRLRIALECRAEATVIGNEAEIREAIANIVDNAIKYAPGSPIRVATDQFDGGVEVTVADEGPGIHPDDREAIFDRFYRGATRGEVEGSGLGLAIAKRALERAGGTLVLSDTTSSGTTFALRLRADRVRKHEPRTAPA